MTSFFSVWIIVLTGITLAITLWVLLANNTGGAIDEKTTGHSYDGIEEWDNPLPRWWVAMFLITMAWGAGYLVMYPGLGNFPGLLGWSAEEQHAQEVAAAEEKYRALRDKYLALPVEEIYTDPKVRRMGMRIYSNNCSQCHGLDAAGAMGFPNLTDDDWLWGGTAEAIKYTLVNGRQAAMPPWESILGTRGIEETTAYILTLNNRDADAELATAGQRHYQTYCVACHGPEAKGNAALGAPNLTNGIWLYGGSATQIAHSLRVGRNGKMPAFGGRLGEDKIHLLTAYVYGLGK